MSGTRRAALGGTGIGWLAPWAAVALSPLAFGQHKGIVDRQLPPSTRPVVTLPGLNNRDIVSVSETRDKGSRFLTRVFRYTFRGDYATVLNGFKQRLKTNDGWTFSTVDAHEGDFWRNPKKGPIAMQGLMVFDARLHQSKWSPTGWAPLPPSRSRGWVWVSYDERVERR